MQKLSLAVKNFNDKVKIMNQTGGKQLVLSADEARNLHADIFNLLASITESQTNKNESAQNFNLNLDGGSF
jgi:hypothetical protein